MYYLYFPEDDKYPCFVLDSDGWDDYSYRTRFDLYYCESKSKQIYIGKTKIIKKNLYCENFNVINVKDVMPSSFEKLGEEYASLGQEKKYYENIRELLHKYDILNELRDCGYNIEYLEGFPDYLLDNRFFRTQEAEKMFIEGRFIISETDPAELFHFSLPFAPKYNPDNAQIINFKLDNKSNYFPNSIYCIIGENGAGKSQILQSIPDLIYEKKIPCHKIIHISNNIYEKGIKSNNNKKPEYIYLGLSKDSTEEIKITDKETIETNIKELLNEIIERYYAESFNRDKFDFVFNTIFDLYEKKLELSEIYCSFEAAKYEKGKFVKQNFERLISSFRLLSSGESILFNNIIKMVSKLQYYSLLLIDEPEVYLHPNFITDYMKFLYRILGKFNSVAVIATHSVFVIREVKSTCVFKIKRDQQDFIIDGVTRETLGTNAMTICEDIFTAHKTTPFYELEIKKMKNNGFSRDEIIQFITTRSDKDLDLGLKMYIHSLYK